MKTAILKIEVPDDFKKGDIQMCKYHQMLWIKEGDFHDYCLFNRQLCSEENCPLEINEEHDCSTTQ